MINRSTGSGSTFENSKGSKELLFSKRSRGKVRLPPLPTRQLTGHAPQQEAIAQSERENKSSVPLIPNVSSPFLTESLLTPSRDYKCPRSPSNLSLQFNFEEPRHAETAGDGPFDERTDRVKYGGRNNQKRVKNSVPKAPHNGRKNKPKGYHVLNNEEQVALVEKQTESGGSHSNSTTGGLTLKSKPKAPSRNDNKGSLGLPREAANIKGRKRSTYDLREFLSLPSDTGHKINSMSAASSNIKPKQHSEKKPANLSSYSSKPKSSDDSTYNLFEFLALSAESSRPSTSVGQNKLKELRPYRAAKGNITKSAKKPEIPSVIVADWSLKDDSPRTKGLIRPSRELPKTNFPRDDFPQKPGHHSTLETAKKSGQRKSVYDLREFLMLPDVDRIHSVQKVKPQEAKPASLADSTREPDVKYDLAEFLNFLEAGGRGLQENTASRERAHTSRLSELAELGLHNRSLSVYDVYEFLKVSSAKELSTGIESPDTAIENKTPIIDVSTLVSQSSTNNVRPVNGPVTKEEKTSQASCYDLREFLRLPVTIESNQNESQTNRSTAERLKIN